MATPWQDLSPKDSFHVQIIAPLTSSLMQVIVNLYQPIIGQNATNLYLFLANQTKDEQLHTNILQTLQLGIRDLYQARIRLEGIALLQVFKLDEESYAYQVEQPLSANDFFETDVLSALLFHQVGEQRFNHLKESLVRTYDNFEGAKNLTRSFLDVYHFTPSADDLQNIRTNDISHPVTKADGFDLQDSSFDYSAFVDGLNKQYINGKSLQEKDVKEMVLMIHEMYGADELDLQKLVFEASDIQTGNVESKELKKIAYQRYRRQEVRPLDYVADEKKESTEEDKTLASLSSQEKSLVKVSESKSPKAFIDNVKKQKNGVASDNEYFAIEKLIDRSTLPISVINILIYFILIVQDNNIVYENYLMDLANEWGKNNIKTAAEAIQFTKDNPSGKKQKPRKQSYNKSSYRKVEKLPDWAVQNTTESDKPVSQEDMEAFKKRISELRKKQKEGK